MGYYTTMKLEVAVEPRFRDDWIKLDAYSTANNPSVSSAEYVPRTPEEFNHPLFNNSLWDFNSLPAFFAVGELLIAVVNMYVKDYYDVCDLYLDWLSEYLVLDNTGIPVCWNKSRIYGTYQGEDGPLRPLVWHEGRLKVDRELDLDSYDSSDNGESATTWHALFINPDHDDGELEGRLTTTIEHRPLLLLSDQNKVQKE